MRGKGCWSKGEEEGQEEKIKIKERMEERKRCESVSRESSFCTSDTHAIGIFLAHFRTTQFYEVDGFNLCLEFWQAEAERLKQQLHNLEGSQRQLLAHDLSGLEWNDLKSLENQLETSLHNVRLKKDKIMVEQIQELRKKENIMHRENMELHSEFNMIRQDSVNFQRKVYGKQDVNGGQGSSVTQNTNTPDDADEIRLELSQPQVPDEKPEAAA
uniref:K-box domain-containing protein n=1 Tax=Oryza glaberrima TaxID=4538 RepID=I1Q295_ORYGL